MTEIVLIASYPKSGNTWVRALVQALSQPECDAVDINTLDTVGRWASDRNLFEQTHGLDPDGLTMDEILALRPGVYRRIAAATQPPRVYMKAHDANIPTGPGAGRLFPHDLPVRIVHVVRHPYDLAASLAHHGRTDLPTAIAVMADENAMEGSYRPEHVQRGFRNFSQLPQHMGSWSGHAASFLDHPPGPTLLLRYEDLLAEPVAQVGRLARFLDLPDAEPGLRAAVEATRFERLAQQEAEAGFVERPVGVERFFRAGKAGAGTRELTAMQKRSIYGRHGDEMRRLGYAETGCARAAEPE